MGLTSFDQALIKALESKSWRNIYYERIQVGDTIRVLNMYSRPVYEGEVIAFDAQNARVTITLRCPGYKHWYSLHTSTEVQREKTFFVKDQSGYQIWGTGADTERPLPRTGGKSKPSGKTK